MKYYKIKKNLQIIIVLMILTLSFTGCDEQSYEQKVEEVIEETENEVKNKISLKKDSFVVEKKKQISDGWYDIINYNMTITFFPTEGIDGPIQQRFKEGTHPKITKDVPIREGYHFIGWTRLEGSNEPEFYSGKRTVFPFTQDTNLYACWEVYNSEEPFAISTIMGKTSNVWGGQKDCIVKHNYNMIKENKGRIIRIQCDCGFELVDRELAIDDFVNIVSKGKNRTYKSLKTEKQEEYKKNHILYCTQDFAPAAVAFISSFLGSIDLGQQNYDEAAMEVSSFLKTLEKAADFDLAYAKSKYSQEYVELVYTQRHHMDNGETIAYALRKMRTEDQYKPYRDFANDYFGGIAKVSEMASTAIGIGRALYYSYDALFTESEDMVSKASSTVKAVHAIVTFCPYVGNYYDNLYTILEEGLELYDKCLKEKEKYYTFLDVVLDGTTVINGTSITINDIEQAKLRNFTAPNSEEEVLPSIMEVLDSLLSYANEENVRNYSLLSEKDMTLVGWYLTMRLEYDFEKQFQITLEDYIEYVK